MAHTTSTPKNEVLQYRNKNYYPEDWHKIRYKEGFTPRDEDFEHIYFKINGIVYTEPSKTFYSEYNKAFVWITLQTTDSTDNSFTHLGIKFGYDGK